MLQHALRTILLVIALVRPASAQALGAPAPGPAFALFRPAPTLPPARPASFVQSSARDHLWDGLVIGGVVGAVLLGTAFYSSCRNEGGGGDCFAGTLATAPVGFVLGGFVGGLVGALIPKKPGPSTTKDRRIQ
jgi:hypothetical protein